MCKHAASTIGRVVEKNEASTGTETMRERIFDLFSPFDRIDIFTPLGIRFWDAAQDAQVSDGLEVTAWPEGMPLSATIAFRTASGIYAFHGLPGLHDLEYPSGDPSPPDSPPCPRRFIIEVLDRQQRFLPVAFSADLPYRGIYPTEGMSSPPQRRLPGFYLFSAPTRPRTASLGIIRAQLEEKGTQNPAGYAVLAIGVPGNKTWYGLADERGCAAVFLPYPVFSGRSGGSSPVSSPVEVREQHWDVSIRVQYDPTALRFPAGSKIPDLRSVLNQAPGSIWSTLALQHEQPVTRLPAELIFGQELVVRTDSAPVLLISRAASPP